MGSRDSRLVLAVTAVAACLCSSATAGAVDVYMEITGLTGGVTVAGYEGTFPVDAAGFGAEVSIALGGGGGAGVPRFGPVTVAKPYDAASPMLALWLAQGRVIDEVILYYVTDGPDGPVEVARTTLADVLVSSFSVTAAGEGAPSESVSFVYTKIEWSVATFGRDGSPGTPVVTGWDLETGTAP